MDIFIVSGKGEGSTLLSAFDTALLDAGVLNYNLICLSSVIPPRTTVLIKDKYNPSPEDFGDRLYVVKAEMRSYEEGMTIGAGIGWYQFADGRGVFVEHHTEAQSSEAAEKELKSSIFDSLRDLCKNRNHPFLEDNVNHSVSTATVAERPLCVLVVAVYQKEKWNFNSQYA